MDKNNTIIIIDYGSQYTQLIARRIRELQVHSIILPYDFETKAIESYNVKGFILSGGPSSVYENDSPYLPDKIFDYKVPILGICYGFQLLVNYFDGSVESSGKAEYGRSSIHLRSNCNLFKKVNKTTNVWMSHGDKVVDVPKKWQITSKSENNVISSASNRDQNLYGVQFHPEVVHTEDGKVILNNFLFKACNAQATWTSHHFIDHQINYLREKVGNEKVMCALSGGVDSTVVAVLLKKALGDNVICVFVDHGLLRKNEAIEVMEMYNSLGLNVNLLDREKEFLSALSEVKEPERKRGSLGLYFCTF